MKEVWFSEKNQITFSILNSLTYGLLAKNISEKLMKMYFELELFKSLPLFVSNQFWQSNNQNLSI